MPAGQTWTPVFAYPMTTVENPLSDGGNFTAIVDALFLAPMEVASSSGVNQAEPSLTNTDCASLYTGAVPANQYVTIGNNTFGGGSQSIILRSQGATSGNYYLVNLSGTAFVLYSLVGGVYTQIGSSVISTGLRYDCWTVQVVGFTFSFYINGIFQGSITDPNSLYASGSCGFGCSGVTPITSLGQYYFECGSVTTTGITVQIAGTQGTTGTTLTSAQSVPAYAQTAGHTIIVMVETYPHSGGNIPTPMDTAGNMYVKQYASDLKDTTRGVFYFNFFVCENCLGNAANVISILWTTGNTSQYNAISVVDVGGAATSNAIDVAFTYGTGATQPVAGPVTGVTTTQANEAIIIFGACPDGGFYEGVPSAGFTLFGVAGARTAGDSLIMIAAKVVSAIQTNQSYEFTQCQLVGGGFFNMCFCVSVKGASSLRELMLMGCGS